MHTFVYWAAIDSNPTMRVYDKLIKHYNGNRRQSTSDPKMIYYELPGTGVIPNEDELVGLCGIGKGK